MTKKNTIIFLLLAALAGCGKKLPTPAGIQEGVPRRVLLELFTATWCTYCPIADSAAERLAAEMGSSVTLIEYHPVSGTPLDPLSFAEGELRGNFYQVQSWPTMVCDGLTSLNTALEYESAYQGYKTAFNNRLLLKSPITINLTGQTQSGAINYHLEITPQQSITQTGLRLVVVVMEDSVSYNAFNGVNLHRYVARQIIPDHQGTAIYLNYGNTFTRDGSITPDPSWNLNRLQLAAFVQSYDTKEVLQSARITLEESPTIYDFILTAPETLQTVAIDSQAEFRFTLKNTGTAGDSLILDVPDSLLHPNVTLKSLCNLTGLCYPIPYTTKMIAAGDSLATLVVHLGSNTDGPIYGTLIATSKADPALQRLIKFYVDVTIK